MQWQNKSAEWEAPISILRAEGGTAAGESPALRGGPAWRRGPRLGQYPSRGRVAAVNKTEHFV